MEIGLYLSSDDLLPLPLKIGVMRAVFHSSGIEFVSMHISKRPVRGGVSSNLSNFLT